MKIIHFLSSYKHVGRTTIKRIYYILLPFLLQIEEDIKLCCAFYALEHSTYMMKMYLYSIHKSHMNLGFV